MDIVAGKITYRIPQGWVQRWKLLSDYKEETGSSTISCGDIPEEEVRRWIAFNLEPANYPITAISGGKGETLDLYSQKAILASSISNMLRLMNLVDPSLILYLHIDAGCPTDVKLDLYRQYGRHLRTQDAQLSTALLSSLVAADPYRIFMITKLQLPEEAHTIISNSLLDFPYDVLVGILATSSPRPVNDPYHEHCLSFATVNWKDVATFCLSAEVKKEYETRLADLKEYITTKYAVGEGATLTNMAKMTGVLADIERTNIWSNNTIHFFAGLPCPNPTMRLTSVTATGTDMLASPIESKKLIERLAIQTRAHMKVIGYRCEAEGELLKCFVRACPPVVEIECELPDLPGVLLYRHTSSIRCDDGLDELTAEVMVESLGHEYVSAVVELLEYKLREGRRVFGHMTNYMCSRTVTCLKEVLAASLHYVPAGFTAWPSDECEGDCDSSDSDSDSDDDHRRYPSFSVIGRLKS